MRLITGEVIRVLAVAFVAGLLILAPVAPVWAAGPGEGAGEAGGGSGSEESESSLDSANTADNDSEGSDATDEEDEANAQDGVGAAGAGDEASTVSQSEPAPVPVADAQLHEASDSDSADPDNNEVADLLAGNLNGEAAADVLDAQAAAGGAAAPRSTRRVRIRTRRAVVTRAQFLSKREPRAFNMREWRPARDTARRYLGQIRQDRRTREPLLRAVEPGVRQASERLSAARSEVFDRRIGVSSLESRRGQIPGLNVNRERGLPEAVLAFFIKDYHAGGDLAVYRLTRDDIRNRLTTDNSTALGRYYSALREQKAALTSLKAIASPGRRAELDAAMLEVSAHKHQLVENLFQTSRRFSNAIAGTEVFTDAITTQDASKLGEGANGIVYRARPEGLNGRQTAFKRESTFAFAPAAEAAGIPERHTNGAIRGMATRRAAELIGLGDMVMETAPALFVTGNEEAPAQNNGLVTGVPPVVTTYVRPFGLTPADVRSNLNDPVDGQKDKLADANGQLALARAERDQVAAQQVSRPRFFRVESRYLQRLLAQENALFEADKEVSELARAASEAAESAGRSVVVKPTAAGSEAPEEVFSREPAKHPAIDAANPRVRQLFSRMDVIDILSGQVDRNSGNYLIRATQGNDGTWQLDGITLIDNDMSFGTTNQSETDPNGGPQPIVPSNTSPRTPSSLDFRVALSFLDPNGLETMRDELRPFLDDAQMSAMEERYLALQRVVVSDQGQPRLDNMVLMPGETLDNYADALARLPADVSSAIRQGMQVRIDSDTARRWDTQPPDPGSTLDAFSGLNTLPGAVSEAQFRATYRITTNSPPAESGEEGTEDRDDFDDAASEG